jgi:hypothetical protein
MPEIARRKLVFDLPQIEEDDYIEYEVHPDTNSDIDSIIGDYVGVEERPMCEGWRIDFVNVKHKAKCVKEMDKDKDFMKEIFGVQLLSEKTIILYINPGSSEILHHKLDESHPESKILNDKLEDRQVIKYGIYRKYVDNRFCNIYPLPEKNIIRLHISRFVNSSADHS